MFLNLAMLVAVTLEQSLIADEFTMFINNGTSKGTQVFL